MKILFTGGGSGGHFYPIISIAEELSSLCRENHLLKPELYFMSTDPYNEGLLFDHSITYVHVSTGKIRRYFSIQNFFDLFKTFFGTIHALWTLFKIYPDVVFGKGGFASFPALLAARILGIPVIIHESDTVPGKVNAWAGKFAQKIAVSYPESAEFFPKGKTAHTGNPIRKEMMIPTSTGAHEFLKLEENVPVIFILGGSQGAQIINETILTSLPGLISKYQIIHQVGKKNIESVRETAKIIIDNNVNQSRYKPFDYLNILSMRMAAGIADVIVSRAGSTIFEIASWGVPSIIIPITKSNGDHQKRNAYAYARAGGCVVIEEKNLTSNIVISEIDRIIGNTELKEKMKKSAIEFSRRDASELIAKEILAIALSHER